MPRMQQGLWTLSEVSSWLHFNWSLKHKTTIREIEREEDSATSKNTTREEHSLKRQSIHIELLLANNAVLVNENIDKKVKFIDRVIGRSAPYS